MNANLPELRYEVRDGLAVLTFSRPSSKFNQFTSTIMAALEELLAGIEEDVRRGAVRALLLRSGKRGSFIARADIDELAVIDSAAAATEISRRGQSISLRLERLPVPTFAAIDGACVAAGLELALACDFRLASDHPSTRLGLTEVRLGLPPALGGSVRMTRLIGLRPALDLILSGKEVSSRRARKLGLVDQLIPAEGFAVRAEARATELVRLGKSRLRRRRGRLKRLFQDGPATRWLVMRLTRRALAAGHKSHYPVLPAALELTVAGLGAPASQAYEREAEAFGRLAVTAECRNLIAVSKDAEAARVRQPPGQPAIVKRAAVVGADSLGAGIAALLAYQTIPTYLLDTDGARAAAGLERAHELLSIAARRAHWSEDDLESRAASLRGATDYTELRRTDIVLEAVVERIDVKQQLFEQIERHVRPDTVIATNTSAFSVSRLQQRLSHPERFCGLHFFYPAHRMPLVEVVRGANTSNDTLATAFDLAVRLGKTPILVNDSPGFVVNRLLAAYLTEAGHLLQSGLAVDTLDRIMSQFGMPPGPLRLLDEIGLDIVAEVSRTVVAGFGERFTPAPIMEAVLSEGIIGRKGGRGFYRYRGSKPRGVDRTIQLLIKEQGQPPAEAEAQERILLAMINEAARTLDDRVVDGPETLDIASILGAGFPPFRGGLLRYADALGRNHILDRLRHYAEAAGSRFQPAPGLLRSSAFYVRPD
ncbi:MAG: enoyl-CoA hydratase/isomerase family protein [Gemmatimonadota bacterium]|nr:MAG: enoyl-CoA hydratase/isomerase family protein [Gemmatimonadota bacterium]